MRSPVGRRPRALALGVWLATRGPLATLGYVLAGVGAAASIVAALSFARHGGHGAAGLPTVVSEAIAWSAGVTVAFGAALRAIEQDRRQGIFGLLRSRGGEVRTYVTSRVGGLVIALCLVMGSPTLVAGLAATAVGHPLGPAVRSSVAALAYSLVFSATLGPVCMAALGARTRVGGYLALLLVLVVPEILSPWTSGVLPRGWHELTSITAALDAVRAGAAHPVQKGMQAVRALAGLAAVVSVSVFVVGMRASRVQAEEAA